MDINTFSILILILFYFIVKWFSRFIFIVLTLKVVGSLKEKGKKTLNNLGEGDING